MEADMSTANVDDIRRQVRIYMIVFGSLMVLTLITVAVSYLHLALAPAVALALVVATVKASLVALYFMHLSHEKGPIYWTLLLTTTFFLFLMFIPLLTELDTIGS
jgi:cytochrome c oxidase subunit IV